MHDSFKLVTFNVYDSDPNPGSSDGASSRGWSKSKGGDKRFQVRMFGINEKGETAAIFVEGFTPFFYVKVGDNWTEEDREGLVFQLQNDMGDYYRGSITSSKLVKRNPSMGSTQGNCTVS